MKRTPANILFILIAFKSRENVLPPKVCIKKVMIDFAKMS